MTAQMKWHNINLSVRIKISPDAKVLIFIICLFILLGLIHLSAKIESRFTETAGLIAFGLGLGIYNDHKNNKLDVEVAEKGLGEKLTEIKKAARDKISPQVAPPEVPRDQ